jgi:hypothetical protein
MEFLGSAEQTRRRSSCGTSGAAAGTSTVTNVKTGEAANNAILKGLRTIASANHRLATPTTRVALRLIVGFPLDPLHAWDQ